MYAPFRYLHRWLSMLPLHLHRSVLRVLLDLIENHHADLRRARNRTLPRRGRNTLGGWHIRVRRR